jgi:hypothetical protein
VVALLGVLLLGGSAVAMALRNRPRPAVVQATAAGLAPAGPAAAVPAPSHAFERLPDDIQKDLLEIGDMLRGMEEGA